MRSASGSYAAAFLVHDEHDLPLAGLRLKMTMPNGEIRIGQANQQGQTSKVFSRYLLHVELSLIDGDGWRQSEINSAH